MAPVDIVIDICKRKADEAHERIISSDTELYLIPARVRLLESGKIEAYKDLIKELEGFKKLFN